MSVAHPRLLQDEEAVSKTTAAHEKLNSLAHTGMSPSNHPRVAHKGSATLAWYLPLLLLPIPPLNFTVGMENSKSRKAAKAEKNRH